MCNVAVSISGVQWGQFLKKYEHRAYNPDSRRSRVGGLVRTKRAAGLFSRQAAPGAEQGCLVMKSAKTARLHVAQQPELGSARSSRICPTFPVAPRSSSRARTPPDSLRLLSPSLASRRMSRRGDILNWTRWGVLARAQTIRKNEFRQDCSIARCLQM